MIVFSMPLLAKTRGGLNDAKMLLELATTLRQEKHVWKNRKTISLALRCVCVSRIFCHPKKRSTSGKRRAMTTETADRETTNRLEIEI